jgi:hypothetical protein
MTRDVSDCDALRAQGVRVPPCCNRCHEGDRLVTVRVGEQRLHVCCPLVGALLRGATAFLEADDEAPGVGAFENGRLAAAG